MEQQQARGVLSRKHFWTAVLWRREGGEEENSGSRAHAVLITSVTSLNVALRKQNHPENH